MGRTKKLVMLSLFVSMALMIHMFEKQIPVLFPGVKLGLSNVVSLTVLLSMGSKEAIMVVFFRVLIASGFGGGISGFLFSIVGGLLSNGAMIFLYKYFKEQMSLGTISIVGAIFHNIGQLLVASFIVMDLRIYLYLPILLISAVITGYFIGICASYLEKHIKNIRF